jgi:hypothetical protein
METLQNIAPFTDFFDAKSRKKPANRGFKGNAIAMLKFVLEINEFI